MIERGIRVFGIWAGDGDPVAIPELFISVENWSGGRTVAVMELLESSGRFHESFDGSSTDNIDMRIYPRELSGSGGAIKLIDNGWYNQFQNAGFSFRGSRLERFYIDDSGETVLNQFYVSEARDLVGLIELQLSPITRQLASDITGSVNGYRQPFIVGSWSGVEIDAVGEGEIPLFDGVSFRYPYNLISSPPTVSIEDIAGAPVEWDIYAVPTSESFQWDGYNTVELDAESYMKIVSGVSEGTILSVKDNLLVRYEGAGRSAFRFSPQNKYGVEITDENTAGIYWRVEDSVNGVSDWASFGFFTNNLTFLKDPESTVTQVSSEGVEYEFIDNTDTIDIKDSLGVVPTIYRAFYPNLRTNSNYLDMKLYAFGGANNWYDWDSSSHIYYTEPLVESSFDQGYNNTNVNDRLRSTLDYASAKGTIRGTERPSIQMSYFCDDIPDKYTGIAIDVEIDATINKYAEGERPTAATVNFESHVVFVYNTVDGSIGDRYVEAVSDTSEILVIVASNNRYQVDTKVVNIGNGFYSDDTTTDTINAPTDNRQAQAEYNGQNISAVLRGSSILEIGSGISATKPSSIYISVGGNIDENNSEYRMDFSDFTIKVKGISFVAENVTRTEPLEAISADVTGRDYSTASVAIEEISKLQNYDQLDTVTTDIDVDTTPVRRYETSESLLNTSSMLQELHKETWTVGYLNKDGAYVSKKVVGLLGSEATPATTHQFTVPFGCKLAGSVKSYEYDSLPTGGTIQYDRQPNGKYLRSITVSGADKEVFDASYVTGVSDETKAYELWQSARLVYQKTGVLVDVRNDQRKLNWLYREADASDYFLNIFKWNGGRGFSRDVISASIEVVDIDSNGFPWSIGDYVSLFVPRITQTDYTGVITGVTFNNDTLSATIDMRVSQVVQDPDTITEVGAGQGADTITELDTNTDTITEKGLIQ